MKFFGVLSCEKGLSPAECFFITWLLAWAGLESGSLEFVRRLEEQRRGDGRLFAWPSSQAAESECEAPSRTQDEAYIPH